MPIGIKGFQKGNKARKKAPHTLTAEKAREYLINEVVKDMEPIVTAQKEAAKGMWIEDLDPNGIRIRVYRKVPDLKAGEYLLNQTVGKATETIEHSGRDGAPLIIKLD